MNIKRSISGRIDKGSVAHNNREFVAPNVDRSRIKDDITLVREDIKTVYHELFDKPLAEYNAKQKRKDRRIKDYYEHIYRGKQEKPFYELIFQIGNTEDTHCGTPEATVATQALTDFVQGFQQRNPHIRVFNAVIHLDEETPHVHIDFVSFATEQKRGLSTRNSLSKALEQQGFISEGKNNTCTKQWVESEKEQLAQVMQAYGIEWEKLGTHEQHLDVLDYKKKMRAQEVAVLESEVAGIQRQLESRQMILNDADNVIERLDKEFVEKTEQVEQLDSDIEEKSAELESTTEQLAVNQKLLIVATEKAAQLKDIDSINVKRSAIGSKVTLSEMDYNSIVELAKKELAAEHDTAEKDDEIYRLNEILQALNKEKALWTDERSALHKTIEKLRSQVRGLTDQLSALKAKYDRVMEFVEKFNLKEKLDKFLHPIKNIKKHR